MSKRMSTSQVFELLCGTAAGAVGLLGLSYTLFMPRSYVNVYDANGVFQSSTTVSYAQMGMGPNIWFNVSLLYVCFFAVIASAVLHSVFRQKLLLGALLCSAGFVLIFALSSIFTTGLFVMPFVLLRAFAIELYIVPAALLALAAAGLGLKVQREYIVWD